MSELIFDDGKMGARASLRRLENEISEGLRLPNLKSPKARINRDGTVDLPSLDEWREAEREARQPLAARASGKEQEKQTP
jgi:hypothetical protein